MLSCSSAAALAPASSPWLGVSSRQLLIVAGGGRELSWSSTRIASALLSHSQGRSVVRLLHGGARGADTAIGGACERLGWSVEILHPQWQRYGRAAGPLRNRQLLQRARDVADLSGLLDRLRSADELQWWALGPETLPGAASGESESSTRTAAAGGAEPEWHDAEERPDLPATRMAGDSDCR